MKYDEYFWKKVIGHLTNSKNLLACKSMLEILLCSTSLKSFLNSSSYITHNVTLNPSYKVPHFKFYFTDYYDNLFYLNT